MADGLPVVENQAGTVEILPSGRGFQQEMKLTSELGAEEQFRVLKCWVLSDRDHLRPFYKEATEAFAFRAGEQWTEEDKAILRGQDRPVIVFNRVLAFLKAVAGMEINGRHDTFFYPRDIEDAQPNEVLNAANRWMGDECDAEDEQSQAFDHSATCGLGFTEMRMAYDENPSGLYDEECIDPREMFYGPTAKKKGLADAKRMGRVRKMALGEAMRMFPGYDREQLDAVWAVDPQLDQITKSLEEKRRRDSEFEGTDLYDDRNEVTIVHIQWIELEDYWLVADTATGRKLELTPAEYQKLTERMQVLSREIGAELKIDAVKLLRKRYRQAFLGNTLLKPAEPAPLGNRFSWSAITGEYDAIKCIFFGLVRVLRDPQMWANKWLSQILHILNTTAKGGILAETDAFEDQREAEDGYARPDTITWVEKGALSGQRPKIMPKPGQGLTDGYVNILQFAISSFRDVSGLNLELMGQQDINQPGVLEAMRKQAGMTILATMFDAVKKFRKTVGRGRLYIIQNYLSDNRLIQVASGVVAGEPLKAVRLAKEQTTGEYNVVVDDAPTSPNQKEQTWLVIQPLIAIFKEQLLAMPEVLMVLLEYSPLPPRIVEQIKKVMVEQSQNPEAKKREMEQYELAVRATLAKIMKDEGAAQKSIAGAQLDQAKIVSEQAGGAYEMAMAQNLLHDNQFNEVRALIDMMEARYKAQTAQSNSLVARAKAERELVGAQTDLASVESEQAERAAKAQREATGALIDEITGVAKARRDHAAAEKDHAIARREDRKPASPAAGA